MSAGQCVIGRCENVQLTRDDRANRDTIAAEQQQIFGTS